MSISEQIKQPVRNWRAEYMALLEQARLAAEILTECYPVRSTSLTASGALDQVKQERFNHERRDA